MKKLIPALCMLLVAACLMGTSTYAWFAANEDVTATGMSIKAASDGGLAIASYEGDAGAAEATVLANGVPTDSDFATTAAANWTSLAANATVKPTSTIDASNWYTTGSDAANVSTKGQDSEYANITNTGIYGNFYQKTKWQIKSLVTGTTNLNLLVSSITATYDADADDFTETNAAQNFKQAIRVAIVCDGVTYIFAPNAVGTANGQPINFTYVKALTDATKGEQATFATSDRFYTSDEIGGGVVISSTLTDTAKDVDVYVYFDGEDPNCTTNNSVEADRIAVTIKYISAEIPAQNP